MKTDFMINKITFHRIIGAILKGVFLGWILSFCLSVFYWHFCGFKMANNRLINMIQTEQYIEKRFSDTKIFSFVESTGSVIANAAKDITYSNELNAAEHQLRGTVVNRKNSYLMPAENKVENIWLYINHGIERMMILAKSNSLMVLDKLLLFILALPLLGLSWLFGVIDGFALREIRIAELGRESSFIFHRFLGFIPAVIWILIMLYLVVPIWINPVMFFIGVSLITLLLTSKTVSKFKKYV